MLNKLIILLSCLLIIGGCGDKKTTQGTPPINANKIPMPEQGKMINPHGTVMKQKNDVAGQKNAMVKQLEGIVVASTEIASQVKRGSILFLSIKPINPDTGAILGNTIAAMRIDLNALPVPFRMTRANMMFQGVDFDGDVLLSARIDQDGDAITKHAGDIEGSIQTKIPSTGITLTLDVVRK